MRILSAYAGTWKSLLGAAVLGLAATAVHAQGLTPTTTALPASPSSDCVPCPGPGSIPNSVMGSGQGTNMTGTGEAPSDAGSFRSVTSGAGYSSNTVVGYIDSAIPQTQLRIRFDAAHDDNEPDRADFFYPKCGCYALLPVTNPAHDSNARGPGPVPESNVNYEELSAYLEYAWSERFSTFIEAPVRFVQPNVNGDTSGFSDLNFGFKYAFLMDPCRVATFQLRLTTPTGDTEEGLGNGLWTLEPGLLFYRRLSERWVAEAELRDYIPVAAQDDFAGNVLRYGVGLSYHAYIGPSLRVTPVGELVGWTCLSGKELDLTAPLLQKSAAGDTIVNAKIGLRFGLGDGVSPGFLNQSDLYVGYGRALTNDVWYKDIYRVELRLRF